MMVPVVALVGRSNVGKSTLFNRLTCTYDALVSRNYHCILGLTRDRKYGFCYQKKQKLLIIDTGGINEGSFSGKGVEACVVHQVGIAIKESDLILFVVDGQSGLVPFDCNIIQYLRKFQKPVFVVVNKIDNLDLQSVKLEFYLFGIKTVFSVSALHNCGINLLLESVCAFFRDRRLFLVNEIVSCLGVDLEVFLRQSKYCKKTQKMDSIILAVVGRPNVGKSTFINYVLNDHRLVVYDCPGTTYDSVCVSAVYNGQKYILIDTFGVCKKNKLHSINEQSSFAKTLKSIQYASVVLLLIDACHGISDDDLVLLKNILNQGKSLVIAVNKWDVLSDDLRKKFRKLYDNRMHFIRFICMHFISSVYGMGIDKLFESIMLAYSASYMHISATRLTHIVRMASVEYAPPRIYRKQVVKFKYAHLGGHAPLIIVIHGSHVCSLTDNYKSYLINYFYRALNIFGVSLRVSFKECS